MKYGSFYVILALFSFLPELRADGVLKGENLRSDFIRSGTVWSQSAGSPQCTAFAPDEIVSCSYKKPKRGDDTGGLTPKFKCKTADGKNLKVKYGQQSAETFTEVFSSRLLQSLGFYADCNYPVAKVVCEGCPENPDLYTRDYARSKEDPSEILSTREFPFAMIEEKFGEEIVAELDGKIVEGWGFREILDPKLQSEDPEQNAAREALTILMAILQHGDNRLSNQRFYCKKPLLADGSCAPEDRALVVQDLGATLGGYKFARDENTLINVPPALAYRLWDFAPVWSLWRGPGLGGCTVQVFAGDTPEGPATLTQQKVSESGRLFLANLLSQLSRDEIEDMVRTARLDQWGPGQVAAKQWVDTLLKKIRSVTANGVCR